ncbi:uncharacterized protein RHOBADRAFT_44992 [Rhodotorula graminis WP1]|uniref:asparaginase n=1 Tax=Rhodotorula graminis (strain WP1) TaxID=578459 RepID=A0A194S1A6_RHOGW|nr:uncharacterized protein RHOBADRAFT_44992 [Rhodotorula graminis WP1]KPV74503.1 hypothetical protein RHOBADRAFT_44992 [Rhodotorula graminis WP1]
MLVNVSLAVAVAASLLGSAAAAPLVAVKQLVERKVNASPDFNITFSSSHTDGLPRTLIMATGGTIAGSSASATDSTNYRAGSIGVAALVDAVPQLLNVSNIDGMQVSNVDSGSITDDIVLLISKLANKALCGSDPEYDAVVVTHGTETLEETAYTLDATLMCDKTVVVVGAMRPATAISADGPSNLLEAVTTAVSPASHGRGVLVVLNDRICQALYCAKTNANALDTFKAYEQGFVGGPLSTKPFFYYPPSQPTFKTVYDLSNVTSLPRVDVLYSHQMATFDGVNASVANGAKGFIGAGTGAGGISPWAKQNLAYVMSQGIPVVASTKINNGVVAPDEDPAAGSYISSALLNPVKSRRLLQSL